ncbi:hypothetical protein B0H17DRAFT_1127799 [Mycena rosella]|uniref:Uncharacterized protein n=1 Tax=Mycena rosella TaxID=1033263 RepID=A0AAD7GMX9_MYCRO|nr:hypothetical protein B0H17DRAFT_1127799 [Mycena rosella]
MYALTPEVEATSLVQTALHAASTPDMLSAGPDHPVLLCVVLGPAETAERLLHPTASSAACSEIHNIGDGPFYIPESLKYPALGPGSTQPSHLLIETSPAHVASSTRQPFASTLFLVLALAIFLALRTHSAVTNMWRAIVFAARDIRDAEDQILKISKSETQKAKIQKNQPKDKRAIEVLAASYESMDARCNDRSTMIFDFLTGVPARWYWAAYWTLRELERKRTVKPPPTPMSQSDGDTDNRVRTIGTDIRQTQLSDLGQERSTVK